MKKFFPALTIVFLTIIFTISSIASTGWVQKSLLYENIKITLDGKELVPTDANGKYVEPFTIDGTTYLPVRAISNALGLNVDWDGNTKTVKLSTQVPQNQNDNKIVYNANGVKITYLGYKITPDGYDYLTINFLIENNSSQEVRIYCDDDYTSINGFMVDGLMVQPVAAGKKANAEYTFSKSALDENNIKTIDSIEVGIYYEFNNKYVYSGALPLMSSKNILNSTQSSSSDTKTVTSTTTASQSSPTTNKAVEVSYKDFVDFVKEKGSIGKDGTYGIQAEIPYHSSSSGDSYGTVTLVYDDSNDELQLQVLEYYESNRNNATTMQFLTVELPKKANNYNWQFQHGIYYPSYSKYDDYFMASEGTLKANVDSYLDDGSISTTRIIRGKEIITGSSASNVGMLMMWVPIYGNKIFSENGSSLSFDYFGIN